MKQTYLIAKGAVPVYAPLQTWLRAVGSNHQPSGSEPDVLPIELALNDKT